MIRRAIIFTEYWFIVGPGGTDHLEGHEYTMNEVLGKGIVCFHNKKGGILRMMFIGEISPTKKAHIIFLVEENCHLKFIDQKEVQYRPEFEKSLKSMYGDKLIVK